MKTLHNALLTGYIILALAVSALAQTAGDYRTAGSGKWTEANKWQRHSGTAWVTATTPPTGSETITLMPNDSIDVVAPISITGKLINTGAKLGNSLLNLTFASNGVYEHALDGGTIPSATWGTGSNCLITGIVGSAPGNARQDFYNFTWNCPNYGASAVNLKWGGNTIKGDVRIVKGAAARTQVRMTDAGTGNAAPGPNVITINGSIYLDDYLAQLTSTGSSGSDTIAVYVKGNIVTSGLLNIASGSGCQANWYVSGNITINGGGMVTNSNTGPQADTLVFVGTQPQFLYKADSLGSMTNIQFNVPATAAVDFRGTSIGGTSTSMKVADGATITSSHVRGFKGNFNVGGAVLLPNGVSYVYNGTSAQIDSLLPGTVKNLTIDNPTTTSFIRPVTVTGKLTLKAGVLDNSVNAIILGPGATVVNAGGTTAVPLGVGVENEITAVNEFRIYQNYPNPFNPSTRISFTVPVDGLASVKIFNGNGEEVANLYDGIAQTGSELRLTFDASNLPSGMYVARLRQGGLVASIKMILMK